MTDFFVTWSRQRDAQLLPVRRAVGDEFVLDEGRLVYDFTSTSFQASFGHSHGPIVSRIADQLYLMPMASPKADFELKRNATKELLDLVNLDGRIMFTVSGAESVENALKIARQQTGRSVVLARKKSYHGATLGAMSVSGDWRRDGHLNFEEGTLRIPEPGDDPHGVEMHRMVESFGPDRVAALIVEPITGTNGVYIPPASWWQAAVDLCRRQGILLICDEVLVGFGRCGSHFAFQQFGIQPDMITMSKGISGGYIPFGAVWVNDRLSRYYDQEILRAGLTNYAHPLGLAALQGVIHSLRDSNFQQAKQRLELKFSEEISRLAAQFNASAVRLRGLLAAIEFGQRTLPAWPHFVDHGLYVFTKANMLILAPPFVSQPHRLSQAFEALHEALAMIR
ncbi:MAG TPA: aspartate aminotransferase family protein [Pirellulaceae bacterium]|nr:aspartate aminotransferase family protein [Pirellulaceae bacterium]